MNPLEKTLIFVCAKTVLLVHWSSPTESRPESVCHHALSLLDIHRSDLDDNEADARKGVCESYE